MGIDKLTKFLIFASTASPALHIVATKYVAEARNLVFYRIGLLFSIVGEISSMK